MKEVVAALFLLVSFSSFCSAGEELIRSKAALQDLQSQYSKQSNHKAFAQSGSGAWGWASNRNSAQKAVDDAIANCTKHMKGASSTCVVLNIDGEWVAADKVRQQEAADDLRLQRESGVAELADADIRSEIENTRGRIAVQFTSYDRSCGFCVRSNNSTQKLLAKYSNNVRFARKA